MPHPHLEPVRAWLKAREAELLEHTQSMLRIPSVEGDAAPGAPFGQPCRDALDLALRLGSEAGMRTKDLEGYVGYAEFGDGPLIASFGHLDVVPVGPGWKHEPFGAEIDDGYVYARGAQDDKGPTLASFYAMRAIQACCPDMGVRMRQVFGCDEESGFLCLARYNQTEEAPMFGIAPDSGWPLYHAEKGIANLEVSVPLNVGAEMELLELTGGQRPNIVIDSAVARVRVVASAKAYVMGKLADAWDRNVDTEWRGDELIIRSRGKAAHGSLPFLGDSAATRALRLLFEIAPVSCESYFQELLESTGAGGAGLGIAGSDEVSKDLTCNLGIAETSGQTLKLLFNIRYPVSWNGSMLRTMAETHVAKLKSGFKLRMERDSAPLYFPLDHPMVKAIVDTYEEETGERKEPGVMGGGTYAREVANTVSIGTGWEGDGKAHETDERLKVEHLFRMSRIYAHIFLRLADLVAQKTS